MLSPGNKKQPGTEPANQAAEQRSGQDIDRENENVAAAYEEASKDIEADPEMSEGSANDDLDEGETARLGENPEHI